MSEHQPNNVILIGYRGSGKTSVGRLLAARLGWSFLDTDALIESQAGMNIADIFATQGEAVFRQHEREVIAEESKNTQQVIAVGGGAVTDQGNVECLRTNGIVVWLTAPAEALWSRIQQDQRSAATRPNLTTGGLAEVRAVLADREADYRAAADLTVNTEDHHPAEVADEIIASLAKKRTR